MLRLQDRFTAPASKSIQAMTELSKRGQRVRRDIERMGDTIGKAGKTLTASVTVPVAGMAAASVKTAADFEASMSQVAATMGKTRDQITDLTDLAQRMGATTAFSASEAAEGINILAMAGLNAAQISDSLGTVLNLAAAGAMDMGSAASYVVGAVKGFGDEMGNASRYADLMAKGATLANTDVQALGEAVSYGAATAAGYSQTVDSMTLALLRMAEQNITGQTAATSLNRAMADLYSPTQEAKAALDRLGVSAYNADGSARDFNTVVDELAGSLRTMSEEEANALKNTIFTTNGMNAFNKMTASSAARVQELWSGLGDAGGSAAQQAATQLDNLNGQITILKSAVEGAAIAFGNRMLPYIKKAAEYAQGLMEQINGLSDAQVDSVIRWAGMAAAAGPVLVVTGKVITGFTKMIPLVKMAATGFKTMGGMIGLVTSPCGLVIAAIVALIAVVIAVRSHFGMFRNSMQAMSPYFESIRGHIQSIMDKFQGVNPVLSAVGSFIVDLLGGTITVAVSGLAGFVIASVDTVLAVLDGFMTVLNGIISFLTGVFTGDWELAWQGASDIVTGVVVSMGAVCKSTLNGIVGAVNGVLGALNGVKIPDWVPGIGGKSINLPTIPALAAGTANWAGGLAQVSERGGEIIDLPRGSRVYPHDESIRMARQEGASGGGTNITIAKLADQIIVREDADIDRIAEAIVRKLKKQSEVRGRWTFSGNMA